MKHQALHWDPWPKMFSEKSVSTVPRLLDLWLEKEAREYEAGTEVRSPEQQ